MSTCRVSHWEWNQGPWSDPMQRVWLQNHVQEEDKETYPWPQQALQALFCFQGLFLSSFLDSWLSVVVFDARWGEERLFSVFIFIDFLILFYYVNNLHSTWTNTEHKHKVFKVLMKAFNKTCLSQTGFFLLVLYHHLYGNTNPSLACSTFEEVYA